MIADEATLARLMLAARKGDKAAYRTLLVEVQHWLERYFRGRIAPSQVDDLVQDVLLAVHAKRASWDTGRPFLPWLAAIARYRWVDLLRKTYRAGEEELGDHDAPGDSSEDVILARMSLERLFVHLPEKQAEAIELVRISGLSVAEASRRTGQSQSLVKVNIHRGLRKLSALVEKAE